MLAWRARGGSGVGRFAAVADRELVLAASEPELKDALESGGGSDSIAFDERFLAELRRLGEEALRRRTCAGSPGCARSAS